MIQIRNNALAINILPAGIALGSVAVADCNHRSHFRGNGLPTSPCCLEKRRRTSKGRYGYSMRSVRLTRSLGVSVEPNASRMHSSNWSGSRCASSWRALHALGC